MEEVKLNIFGTVYNCKVLYQKYQAGGHRIDLIDLSDGMPVATATVHVPGVKLENNEVIIKDYSENEGIYNALLEYNIIKETSKSIQISDYIKAPIATLVKLS